MTFIFDLDEAIDCYLEPVTIIQRSGAYVGPRFTEDSQTSSNELAVVQPLNGRDLQNLPEGEQAVGAKAFITKFELFIADERLGIIEDFIIHESRTYKAITVEPWNSYGYFRTVGTLLGSN